jgi:ribosomal protein S18 acetylase RimI-like enzyme
VRWGSSVNITIIRAAKDDIPALAGMDRKCFLHSVDWGDEEYYAFPGLRSFWVIKGRRRIGSVSLMHHRTISRDDNVFARRSSKTLYIVSTAILPEFRRRGVGDLVKAWQIKYAKANDMTRIITNARASNAASIALNKKFGFVEIEHIPDYYPGNNEHAVVLELSLE